MTRANVDTLRDTASDAWEQVQRAKSTSVKEGKRQAGRLLDETGELIEEVQSLVSDKTAGLSKSFRGFAKKSPLTALLLAAGAGAIVFGASRILQAR